MAGIPVDVGEGESATADNGGPRVAPSEGKGKRRAQERAPEVEVEIEREVTKRHLIEAISSVLVIVLYMAFTLFRDRDTGVVVLDEDRGPEDDWEEA